MGVLADIKNRGVRETFFLICDGLKGLPDVVGNVWPLTTVQTCIIHLFRNTFRLLSKKDWDALKREVKPIYTAPKPNAAKAALENLDEKWEKKYGAIIWLWESVWEEFTPILDYDFSDPHRDLLNERDRIPQRPIPACGPSPRALPDRAGGAEVPVSCHS